MIFIDIETRPNEQLIETYLTNLSAPKNYKDEEKIKEWLEEKKLETRRNLSLDQDYSEIACIAIKIDDHETELTTLEAVGKLIDKDTIVTFNGKTFDLPIMIKCGIKSKLDMPYRKMKEMTKKWNSLGHIDLMELLSFNKDYKSLDQYLQIYLGIKKTPIDFNTCSQEELENHCKEDVENLYKLYKLFENII